MSESFPPGLFKHYTWSHVAEALMQYVSGKEPENGERKGSLTTVAQPTQAQPDADLRIFAGEALAGG